MATLYTLRVIFFSSEALVLGLAWLIHLHFDQPIQIFASSLSLNDEVLKYLMMLPVAIGVWVINESRLLLQQDDQSIRILTAWPHYWRLRIHAIVGLAYAIVFSLIAFIPWTTKAGISTGTGMILFATSILGQLSLAASVYMARITVNEILAPLK